MKTELYSKRRRLARAVSRLPELEQHIVERYYYFGETQSEIADALRIPESKARVAHLKALHLLRNDIAHGAFELPASNGPSAFKTILAGLVGCLPNLTEQFGDIEEEYHSRKSAGAIRATAWRARQLVSAIVASAWIALRHRLFESKA